MANKKLQVDPNFKSLIRKLSKQEYQELEKSILSEGCRDPLVLWNGVLLDGHNRYRICKKNNIPFKTVQLSFEDRLEARIWILKISLSRRNLSLYDKAQIGLQLEPLISKKAKQNQRAGGGSGISGR